MYTYLKMLLLSVILIVGCSPSVTENSLSVEGLTDQVKVVRDSAGINHIYAQNQQDLFFSQGYLAAKDRLFQFEIWRRQATGTVAEILGSRELQRDIGTRLFKFRGDMKTEMNYYHDQGEEIITSYVAGVNAYIEEVLNDPDQLPVTFKMLGIEPQKWTPEVVISRHQGLLGNIGLELEVGRMVAGVGAEKAKKYYWFHPKDPDLTLDASITSEMLSKDILKLYNAYRQPVQFLPEDVAPAYRASNSEQISAIDNASTLEERLWLGSNNWVTRPALAANGQAYMANDPHRRLAVPSLRYMVHLVAPGWNVIGGGEPEIPGISIGHNENGAWGLTVFRTDGEDLYVYDLNPDNLAQYKYGDTWEDMEEIVETFQVKAADPVTEMLRYTRHGPVSYIDTANLKAYAVRCAWMEPGGSPYLASLRMDQAKTWEEFRAACNYSHIPGENMVWADKDGNIGWQAVGIAPVRRNFSGMVPVPGDGRYEWDGYLPIIEKPNVYNPDEGFFATANQNVTSDTYKLWDAIGFTWADPFRGDRVEEVLGAGETLTMQDMMQLQTDYYSKAAEELVPWLADLELSGSQINAARDYLTSWDYRLGVDQVAAAIYVAWENELKRAFFEYFPDRESEKFSPTIQLSKIVRWLKTGDPILGDDPKLFAYLIGTFESAVQGLNAQLGSDMNKWQYGQMEYKHVQITHPLSLAVNESWRQRLNSPAAPRGGNQYTPGATSGSLNQGSGASFRVIVDTGDWDASVGTNSPGQSGDPDSPFYMNLFGPWSRDQYFPLFFTDESVEGYAYDTIVLVPTGR